MHRMPSVKLLILAILVNFSYGHTQNSSSAEEQEGSTVSDAEGGPEITTFLPYPEELSLDCVTNKGTNGACKSFRECFPLMFHEDPPKYSKKNGQFPQETSSSEAKSFLDLKEEVFQTLESEVCKNANDSPSKDKGSLKICCEIPTSYEELELIIADQPVILSVDMPVGDNISGKSLPEFCGQTVGFGNRIGRGRGRENVTGKITGGRQAKPGQFPWMVAIFGKTGKHTCGGSLISNSVVLTAAHCLHSYNAKDITQLKVTLGDFNINSLADGPHETRRISKIILHKGFNSKTYNKDIALIELDYPVNFSGKIQPICLPQEDSADEAVPGSQVVIMGWGQERSWGSGSSVLRMVEVPVWNYRECFRVFSTFAPGRLSESNLCAGDGKKNKDACIGDSGGPLVQYGTGYANRWTQYGIVSWGKGCGSFPGVYTSTKSYVSWIKNNIAKLK